MAVVTPDLSEIFEEAFERAGLEMRSGYDLKTVRRSLNILQLEWQNRGLNLFMIESGTQVLTAGTATYTMPTDTIDLIEHQLRTGTGTNQLDQNIERISVSSYAQQGSKNTQGRPTQIYVDRQATAVNVTLWPVPDDAYTLFYYRMKGSDGVASGIAGSASLPPRFIPALCAGLAFHVAMKKPKAQALAPALRDEYEKQFALAAMEDHESATLRITPMAGYM